MCKSIYLYVGCTPNECWSDEMPILNWSSAADMFSFWWFVVRWWWFSFTGTYIFPFSKFDLFIVYKLLEIFAFTSGLFSCCMFHWAIYCRPQSTTTYFIFRKKKTQPKKRAIEQIWMIFTYQMRRISTNRNDIVKYLLLYIKMWWANYWLLIILCNLVLMALAICL